MEQAKMMTDEQKLKALRIEMQAAGADAYLVPTSDAYLGEYVPDCAQRLAWLTGFTGSAGLAIILQDQAVVMSDGRYTIQLAQQVNNKLYSVENSQKIMPEEWLIQSAAKGIVVGYDAKIHTLDFIKKLEGKGFVTQPVENLIDRIWQDQPAAPVTPVRHFPEAIAGRSAQEKIQLIQAILQEKRCDGTFLTKSDSIAWLLNIRGNDIPYTPVCLSYLYVPVSGAVQWFVNSYKLSEIVKDALGDNVAFRSEDGVGELVASQSNTLLFDPKRSPVWFYHQVKAAGAQIIEGDDPCLDLRAQKTAPEIQAMRGAHIRDGVAVTKFLYWLKTHDNPESLNELDIEAKLEAFRAQAPEFQEPSFPTIAGFGPNGAIVHYRATEKTALTLQAGSLLLVDSGAQYEDGTTDITRTIAIGTPTEAMKRDYTLVLKAHIALAKARFDEKTTGKTLDALARQPLLDEGMDYAHGTGHGVGCNLSVHEEAAEGLSPRATKPLKPGMILSNEPGYYKEGAYGIRLENLVLVVEDREGYCFDTITYVPFDQDCILPDILSEEEKDWLNDYHRAVFEKLAPYLESEAKEWLKHHTQKIA